MVAAGDLLGSGWLVGCLGWVAGWLAGWWLVGGFASGWLRQLDGWLAGWPAGLAGRLTSWLIVWLGDLLYPASAAVFGDRPWTGWHRVEDHVYNFGIVSLYEVPQMYLHV